MASKHSSPLQNAHHSAHTPHPPQWVQFLKLPEPNVEDMQQLELSDYWLESNGTTLENHLAVSLKVKLTPGHSLSEVFIQEKQKLLSIQGLVRER